MSLIISRLWQMLPKEYGCLHAIFHIEIGECRANIFVLWKIFSIRFRRKMLFFLSRNGLMLNICTDSHTFLLFDTISMSASATAEKYIRMTNNIVHYYKRLLLLETDYVAVSLFSCFLSLSLPTFYWYWLLYAIMTFDGYYQVFFTENKNRIKQK